MVKKNEKKVVVNRLMEVSSSEGTEEILHIDRAWARAYELPLPVNVRFLRFVKAEA